MFGNGRLARAKLDGSEYEIIKNVDFGGYFSVNEDGSVKGNDSFNMLASDSLNPYYSYDKQVYYINPTDGTADVIVSKDDYVTYSKNTVLHYDYYEQKKFLSIESVDIMNNKVFVRFNICKKTESMGWRFNYDVTGGFLIEKDLDSGKIKLIYKY